MYILYLVKCKLSLIQVTGVPLNQKFKGSLPTLILTFKQAPTQTSIPDMSPFPGHRCHCGCYNCRAHKEQVEGEVPCEHPEEASLCSNRVHSSEGMQKEKKWMNNLI